MNTNITIAALVILSCCAMGCLASIFPTVGSSPSPSPVTEQAVAKVHNLTAEMRNRWEQLDASCDAKAAFALAYTYMISSAAKHIEAKYFDDGNSVADLIANAGQRYITALDAWAINTEDEAISSPWREAFSWAASGRSNVSEDLFLGMNAHVNYDLGIAAFEAGFHSPNKKADYERLNDQIAAVLFEASSELAEKYDPAQAPTGLMGVVQITLIPVTMSWRASAWNQALMYSLARTTKQKSVFLKGMETQATLSALKFEVDRAETTAVERIAYCQVRHTPIVIAHNVEQPIDLFEPAVFASVLGNYKA